MMFAVDDTLRPASQTPDELVPSNYALRVGEIDVLVISDGVIPLPATTLATNADPAELAAWLDDMRQPPDMFKWARSTRTPLGPRGIWPSDWRPPASIPHP